MQGHLQIIQARLDGYKPRAIFFEVGFPALSEPTRFDDFEKQISMGILPTVAIDADEIDKRLDLRFVRECRVHLHGKQMSDALLALAERMVAYGATHAVVACVATPEVVQFRNGEWSAYGAD